MMSNDAYMHNWVGSRRLPMRGALVDYLPRYLDTIKVGSDTARPHAETRTCGTSGVSCSKGGIGAVPSTAQTSAGREVHGTLVTYPGTQP